MEFLGAILIWLVFWAGCWTIALGMLIVFVLGFPYWMYTSRKRQREEKEQKEETKRKHSEWLGLPR